MEMLTALAQNHLSEKIIPNGDSSVVSNETNEDPNDVPDDDAIKMFVGQVPRSMDENALKEFFEEYGRVYQLNVLRDKNSGVSRGCCFVTFYKRKHALDAQNALHNVKTMPGMHHAIQMKPADTENRNERKIFVGMVSKKMGEEEVKGMFSQFGPIEDCTVLRDDNGISRGCAFVTFTNRQIAILAIKAMHHSLTMEGCSSPLVVKFADTQKDKEQKKIQQMQTSIWNLATVNPTYSLPTVQSSPAVATSYNYGGGGSAMLGSPLTMGGVTNVANPPVPSVQHVVSLQSLLQHQQYMGMGLQHQQYLPQSQQQPDTLNGTILGTQDLSNSDMSQLALMSLLQQQQQQQQQSSSLAGSLQPGLNLQSYMSGMSGTVSGTNGSSPVSVSPLMSSLDQTTAGTQLVYNSLAAAAGVGVAAGGGTNLSSLSPAVTALTNNNSLAYLVSATTGGKIKTPDGTSVKQGQVGGTEGANNLFIYHLPQEFTDADLVTTFQPFGTIVSAKVFIDKQTNLSKCFGFVSYTTIESAQAAIQAMNGFQIGTKRLKVQIKKPKDVSKPY